MEPDTVVPARSKGNAREAVIVFIVTIIVAVAVITATQIYAAEASKKSFPLTTGDWIEYRITGQIARDSVGGGFIYYFTERIDRGINYYIATLVPRAPTDQSEPFSSKPMVESMTFQYDDMNIYAIGDLLVQSMSEYDGVNASDMPMGWYGEFVDYQDINQNGTMIIPYTNGEASHYIKNYNGIILEQWIANDTGLPIKLRYADNSGTDISITLSYTSIEWIDELPRYN